MDDASKSALKAAILKSLPLLRELPNRFQEYCLVWKNQGNSWHGQFELRPDIGRALAAAQDKLEAIGSDFCDLFFKAHPEYGKGLVGFAGLGGQNFSHDKGS